MKNKITFLLALAIAFSGFTQLNYSKVKIYASNAELFEISNLGVTVDHGQHKQNHWFVTDLSAEEIAILDDNGYPYEILIEDVSSYYVEHQYDALPKSDRADCEGSGGSDGFNPIVPDNFNLGTMGGYYTYEEYLAELDEMRAEFPDLITEKAGISDFETWEGRPIYWVRISDNPEVDEDEEEVLYSSIHHAREPMSLSQTIFYMWYLLENYGTDEEITYLVNNTEMYFVPMINPDGYKYNHTIEPDGGGMHRKNRNPDIGWTNKGVDLNRNYSYHWNESGTSPSENGDTYAGISAFSEPETQAIKWFCENREFKFAHNAHSHGDLLLYPIGWATDEFAPDHDYFVAYSNHMTIHNGYVAQKATALYPAAGDSDDWMYIDDLDVKPEIFAMTPEVGDAFWPPVAAIEPTCKEMVFPNKVMAHLPHIYGVTSDLEAGRLNTTTGYLNYDLQRLGLTDGPIAISMTALVGIESLGDLNTHDLELMETEEDSISYELVSGIAFGDEIKYVIHTDNGLWTRHDTITKTFGSGTAVFFDDCSDLSNWTGEWDFTDETSYSPSTCITDSPYDDTYGNNVEKEIVLNEEISLEGATYAYATFHAKWEIENDYDYVEFMASTDGGDTWTPLCGKYTNPGVEVQDFEEPLYDGIQNDWVLEEVDLSDYLGVEEIRFKFILITDPGLQMDGYYFDDFSIYTDGVAEPDNSGIEEFNESNISVYPNPAQDNFVVQVSGGQQIQQLFIYDELGKQIDQIVVNGESTINVNVSSLTEGIYYLRLMDSDSNVMTKRVTVIR